MLNLGAFPKFHLKSFHFAQCDQQTRHILKAITHCYIQGGQHKSNQNNTSKFLASAHFSNGIKLEMEQGGPKKKTAALKKNVSYLEGGLCYPEDLVGVHAFLAAYHLGGHDQNPAQKYKTKLNSKIDNTYVLCAYI